MVKKVVIFGASGGIGKEIVKTLSSSDYEILKERVDVTNAEDISKYIKEIRDVDIMIYCVGKMDVQNIHEISINDFKSIFDVNLFGAFNVAKALIPVMRENGHFIFISSLRALEPCKSRAAYCSSKAALDMFVRVLQKEIDIKITIIRPGYVDTDLHKGNQKYPYSKKTGKRLKVTQPRDIAEAVLFVLRMSKESSIKELNIGQTYGDLSDVYFRKEN